MKSKTISVSGEEIHYLYNEKKGRPLLLIHGFAEDSGIWRRQIEALENDYRLIVPDLPGSGASPKSIAKPDMEYFASLIYQLLLQEEDAFPCTMIGHSMGGYITLAFAEAYSNSLQAWGLFHSTAFADTEAKKESRKKSIEFIQRNGAAAFIAQSTPGLFAASFREQHAGLVQQTVNDYTNFLPEVLVSYYEAMMQRPDRTQLLKNTKVPVLFVAGMEDQAVPLADSLAQCHWPSVSYVLILEAVAHMGMLEASEKCNQFISKFLGDPEMRRH